VAKDMVALKHSRQNGINKDRLENDFYKHQIGNKRGGGKGEETEGKEKGRTE
jgi:hypothetical protein